MKKPVSFKRIFVTISGLIMLITFLGLFFLIGYSVRNSYKQIHNSANTTLHIYKEEITTELDRLAEFNQYIFTSEYNFSLLSLNHYSDSDKIKSIYDLRKLITQSCPSYGGIMVFDSDKKVNLYHFGSAYHPRETLQSMGLEKELTSYWIDAEDDLLYNWQLYKTDSHSLLMNAYRLKNMYICSFVDLDRFQFHWNETELDNSLEIAFFDQEDIITNHGTFQKMNLSVTDLLSERTKNTCITEHVSLDVCGLHLASAVPISYLWNYSKLSILIASILFFVISVSIYILLFFLRRFTLYPLEQLSIAAELLEKDPNATLTLQTDAPVLELQKINTAIEDLLKQKISLQEANEKKEHETVHAQLQYFQLQTRSHFFANCLKSLYSMLENKSYDRMRLMILAFSNHLRYVFHDNLSLVPLSAELEEVGDYYKIIQFDSTKPIILSQHVEKNLYTQMVPPLIIQTFLENSIKYSRNMDQPLRFVIQIDKVEIEDNCYYMRIRLNDNGIGYPDEVLEKINQNNQPIYAKNNVGIHNLRKRIELLYGSKYQFACFNERTGGACTLICLPIQKDMEV